MHSVFADSWYGGKGLKQGDYFRYSVCYIEYHNCIPLNIGFWVKNQSNTSGDYFLQMFAIDGSNFQKGIVMTTPALDPVYSDPNIANYSNVYKNTILYLGKLSPSDSPKDFSYPTWSNLGMCCGYDRGIRPLGQEQVTVQAGSYKTWVVGFNDTNSNSNIKFWVEPSMPFPVKGIWTYITQGTSNLQFSFELLELGNSQTEPAYGLVYSPQTSPQLTSSPLYQFKSGVMPENVKCHDGLQAIGKRTDGSPACVSSLTFTKLISRGWGYDPMHEWTITGLNDTYKVGQRIDFTIGFHGSVYCCIGPDVSVTAIDGKSVWQTHFSHICNCPMQIYGQPLTGTYEDRKWNVNDLGFGVLSINKTGQYIVNVPTINKTITIIPVTS